MTFLAELNRARELAGLTVLAEAKCNAKADFQKVTDFDTFNDDLADGHVEEDEIDGKHVVAAKRGKDVVGLWYNRAGVGSFNAKHKGDLVSFAECDPHWPFKD